MRLPLTARTRFEPIADITATTQNAVYNLPTQGGTLPMDRFIHSLLLRVRLRMTMPGANPPSSIHADAPYSLINRVVVSGRHRIRNQQEEFINLRGPELFQLAHFYQGHEPYTSPGREYLSISASATNDIDFFLPVPFTPLKVPGGVQDEYALDAPNYDNLKLDIYWGDPAQCFALGSGTVTFSAFGSSSGNPQIRVYGRFYQAGPSLFKGFVPGRVFRTYTEVTGSPMTTTANSVRLATVPKGYRLRGVMIKAGVRGSATSGNDTYASVSDSILSEITFMRGLNKSIRLYHDLIDAREEIVERYGATPWARRAGLSDTMPVQRPVGHGLIDFVPFGYPDEILDLRGLTAGPTGDTDVYIQANVAGAANQGAVFVWEEWRYGAALFSK